MDIIVGLQIHRAGEQIELRILGEPHHQRNLVRHGADVGEQGGRLAQRHRAVGQRHMPIGKGNGGGHGEFSRFLLPLYGDAALPAPGNFFCEHTRNTGLIVTYIQCFNRGLANENKT